MAQKWYPVIDIMTCMECGTCVGFCSHGVYDKQKAPSPLVVNPEGCIDHCHGCGNKCPVGAISYVGDDTGWVAPALAEKGEVISECGCGCGCDSKAEKETITKEILVEYLYLGLNTCDRCIGTDKVLEEVLEEITPALNLAGYSVGYQKVDVTTAEIAEKYQFLSSPTIRVNGTDICDTVSESDCACCGEISGTSVDCRVFKYEGNTYEIPPKSMIAELILKKIFSADISSCECGNYTLPTNLKQFFEGKNKKSSCCSCSGDCC